MEKSASASLEQTEVLQAVWPPEEAPLTKLARLSHILSAGAMVEEAELSLAENAG